MCSAVTDIVWSKYSRCARLHTEHFPQPFPQLLQPEDELHQTQTLNILKRKNFCTRLALDVLSF